MADSWRDAYGDEAIAGLEDKVRTSELQWSNNGRVPSVYFERKEEFFLLLLPSLVDKPLRTCFLLWLVRTACCFLFSR